MSGEEISVIHSRENLPITKLEMEKISPVVINKPLENVMRKGNEQLKERDYSRSSISV